MTGVLSLSRLLDVVPRPQALRLLVREVDVALFRLALVAHDVDFIARLETGLALVVQNFGERQHTFGLGADVDDDVRAGELQNRALDDTIFADGFLGFGSEGFERCGKIFGGGGGHGWFLFLRRSWSRSRTFRLRVRRIVRSALARCRALLGDSGNRSGGIVVVGGGVVGQGHSLSATSHCLGCGTDAGCLADCRNGSKVVVGSTWRLSLNNPSVRTTKANPRPMGTLRV